MHLPTPWKGACASPHKDKQPHETGREHDTPPAERDADEDSVLGEVERPPRPSEKPQAPGA